jgi:hypothetical protein
MAAIFPTRPGQVVAVKDTSLPAQTQPAIQMRADGDLFSFEATTSIITRLTIAQQTNFQFLHTLGQQIFIYSFGDRIGQMTVSGISFFRRCDEGAQSQIGIEKVLNFYARNKLSRRQDPVSVTLGRDITIQGFIQGSRADVIDPKQNLFSFSFQIAVIPEEIPEET